MWENWCDKMAGNLALVIIGAFVLVSGLSDAKGKDLTFYSNTPYSLIF